MRGTCRLKLYKNGQNPDGYLFVNYDGSRINEGKVQTNTQGYNFTFNFTLKPFAFQSTANLVIYNASEEIVEYIHRQSLLARLGDSGILKEALRKEGGELVTRSEDAQGKIRDGVVDLIRTIPVVVVEYLQESSKDPSIVFTGFVKWYAQHDYIDHRQLHVHLNMLDPYYLNGASGLLIPKTNTIKNTLDVIKKAVEGVYNEDNVFQLKVNYVGTVSERVLNTKLSKALGANNKSLADIVLDLGSNEGIACVPANSRLTFYQVVGDGGFVGKLENNFNQQHIQIGGDIYKDFNTGLLTYPISTKWRSYTFDVLFDPEIEIGRFITVLKKPHLDKFKPSSIDVKSVQSVVYTFGSTSNYEKDLQKLGVIRGRVTEVTHNWGYSATTKVTINTRGNLVDLDRVVQFA